MGTREQKMTGYRATVLSEIRVPGITVQWAVHHWDAGAKMVDCEPQAVLRWRLKPHAVKIRGYLKPGETARLGRLMLHPANVEIHAIGGSQDEDIELLICRLDDQLVRSVIGAQRAPLSIKLEHCLDFRNINIDHAIRRLAMEVVDPGFASEALAESLGLSIAVDLARSLGPDFSIDKGPIGKLSKKQLRRIHDYVYAFTEGSPKLSDISDELGLSAAHLRRIYKSTTGQTLHGFVEETKISRAKSLLANSKFSLKEVSYSLGFGHPSAFSFAFKRVTGESPRDYRLASTSCGTAV